MNIEVKGHSGCQIDVVTENDNLYVCKSTSDVKYLTRLQLQAKKQQEASRVAHQHIRVPHIYDVITDEKSVVVKMQYIYSKNFVEFFNHAGFEQIDYLIESLKYFIDYEVSQSQLTEISALIFQNKFAEIESKVSSNQLYSGDLEIQSIITRSKTVFMNMGNIVVPVGTCHGDLTFSNILFNGNNYYLIDFLDSFIESPLQDIVKLRQDTVYRWSQLMYSKQYDNVRLHIIFDKIDKEIDRYFSEKYRWYSEYYKTVQLMNILRILPYAHEENVIKYLKDILMSILAEIELNTSSDNLEEQMAQSSGVRVRNLIVPVAADKKEYNDGLPYVFGLDGEGTIICLKSILGLDLTEFDHIYFTILKKHDEKFFVGDNLRLQFKRLGIQNAKVVVLNNPTRDQAETIYQTIIQEDIKGGIFIKDADSYFKTSIWGDNGIAIYPIEELDILTPKDKSYVAVDDMYYPTNIIEKNVVGHYISAGGYLIRDTDIYMSYYNRLRDYGRLYLSHIIYAMLLDKKPFRPMLVEDYKDWGTINDLKRDE